MKLRRGDPWVPALVYGRSLSSLSVNLLVREVSAALIFHTEVLRAQVVYSDPDFAVVRGYGTEWMLHADHTYRNHPLYGLLAGAALRGAGVELRLHGCAPDAAEAAAARLGFRVLAAATDKPHGLREAYILDGDGYLWVPDQHSDLANSDGPDRASAA